MYSRTNVTIFGESAGSFSVDALVRCPAGKGLFRKAIAQSGTLVSTWSPHGPRNVEQNNSIFRQKLNVEKDSDIRKALLKMSFQDLVAFEQRMRAEGLQLYFKNQDKINLQVPGFYCESITKSSWRTSGSSKWKFRT